MKYHKFKTDRYRCGFDSLVGVSSIPLLVNTERSVVNGSPPLRRFLGAGPALSRGDGPCHFSA